MRSNIILVSQFWVLNHEHGEGNADGVLWKATAKDLPLCSASVDLDTFSG